MESQTFPFVKMLSLSYTNAYDIHDILFYPQGKYYSEIPGVLTLQFTKFQALLRTDMG